MNSAIERLLTLRVADVMARKVIDVSDHDTMFQAAARLDEQQLSGAPVTDAHGMVVGMLTATDFMRWELKRNAAGSVLAPCEPELRDGSDGPYSIELVPGDLVAQHMAKAVQGIAPDATLLDAARRMCASHIHRLPVIDSHGSLLGIVSTLDIVAAMVHAVEE